MIITIIQFVIASTAVVIVKMIAVTHYLLCSYIKITSTSTILIITIKTAIMNIKDYSYTHISMLAEFLLSGLPVHLRIHVRDPPHEASDDGNGTVECLLTVDDDVVAIFQRLDDLRQSDIVLVLDLAGRRTRVDVHPLQMMIGLVLKGAWPVRAVHHDPHVDVLLVERFHLHLYSICQDKAA